MTPIQTLMAEHKDITSMLEVLARVASILDEGTRVSPSHMEKILGFLKGYADGCHHRKEEEYLFPEMEKAGVPKESGPIGVMLTEHDLGRAYMKEMRDSFEAYVMGDERAAGKFSESARSYINLLWQHIEKENMVLFPLADRCLSAGRQLKLTESFERMETGPNVKEKHAEFRKLLMNMRKIYLS